MADKGEFNFHFIRAISCMLVFTSHYGAWYDFLHFPRGTSIGISMFAWMSGYLLAGKYDSFGFNYYKNRLLRIYPTVFCVTAFGVFYQKYVADIELVPDIFLLLAGGSNVIFPHAKFQGIGGGMWFVSFILICYLALPIIKKMMNWNSGIFLGIVFLGVGIWVVNLRSSQETRLYVLFYESFVWFCMGCVYSQNDRHKNILSATIFIKFTFIISWGGIIYYHFFFESLIVQYISIIIIPLWAYPMFSRLSCTVARYKWLKSFLMFISVISFEIYLVHFYILPAGYQPILNFFSLGKFFYLFYCFSLTVACAYMIHCFSYMVTKLLKSHNVRAF